MAKQHRQFARGAQIEFDPVDIWDSQGDVLLDAHRRSDRDLSGDFWKRVPEQYLEVAFQAVD